MPHSTSITEALAELKTTTARITKKEQWVLQYLTRPDIVRDPLGDSKKELERETQAIRDLQERRIRIRRAIAQRNQQVTATIGTQTRSIADWLVWKREVAPGLAQFLQQEATRIQRDRQAAESKGGGVVKEGEGTKSFDLTVNIDEKRLHQDMEQLEQTLGELDGRLSLLNATTTVTIDD